jgi:hypothetical protein
MFGVKSVNLLCALLNTGTSHSRHKIPLSALCNTQRLRRGILIVSVIMRVLMRLVLLKSRSLCLCLWAAAGAGARSQAQPSEKEKNEKGWTAWLACRMDMEAPHARGGGRGGVVVALTCGETRSVPRRPPPASHRPSLSLLCAFLQRVNNYPCDKHGSCAPDDEKHARRSLSVDSCLSLAHSLARSLFRAR